MSEKDFLSQFSDENKKPDSFKEEERIPIQKDRKPIKPWMIIVPIVTLLVLGVIVWFLFLRPNIEVPDFIGKTKEDVAQWVTQQNITKTGIVFNEEYSFEYDKGQIMEQSVDAGTKVKKDAKITFKLSLGADPDEKIVFPDVMNMTQDELNTWKEENKLLNTKITTTYSSDVETGKTISFSFRGCDADTFTRGCTLNISVSKGPAPAGTVQITDFKNSSLASVETWAQTNKITLDIKHVFDDNIASGSVISTSPESGKTIKEGETLTVIVSQGKGVKVPDFTKMANKEIDKWLEDNANYVNVTKKYFNKTGYVVSQSVKTGGMIGTEDKLDITLNLGNSFYLEDLNLTVSQIIGMQYDKLVDWTNNNRYLGIDAYAGQWGENTSVYSESHGKGEIVSIECSGYSDGKIYDCDGRLPLDVRFSVVVSKGLVKEVDISKAVNKDDTYNVAKLTAILSEAGITFQNNANGLTCELYINGKQIKNSESVIRVILEEDTVILKGSSVGIPEPTSTPTAETE